jgi:hypothetical protein
MAQKLESNNDSYLSRVSLQAPPPMQGRIILYIF